MNRKSISTIEGQTRLVVGIMVLLSVALAAFVNTAWLGLTALIGFALVAAAFTGICPMEFFIARCPWNRQTIRP